MPFFDIFAFPRWSPLRMRTKVGSFFIFFQDLSNKKKIKALRPKMTKIASRGGSCHKWAHCLSVTIHWPLPRVFPYRGPLKPHWWAVEPLWRFRTQPCQHRPYWCFLTHLPFRSGCRSSAIWSSLAQVHSASLFLYESDGIAESESLSARMVARTSKHRPKVVAKT